MKKMNDNILAQFSSRFISFQNYSRTISGSYMQKRQLAFILSIVFSLCMLSACGQGSSNTPQAPATLTFTGSNLENFNNNEVPKNIPAITIQVAEDLNRLSVNENTVHLMPGNGSTHQHNAINDNTDELPADGSTTGETTQPPGSEFESADSVAGFVDYDSSTRSIIFQPKTKLAPGYTYHLRIHDVELSDGRKVKIEPKENATATGVIQFNFTTAHEHEVLRTQYNSEGVPSSYVTYVIENNIKKKLIRYNKDKEIIYTLEYDTVLDTGRSATSVLRDKLGVITQYYHNLLDSNNNIIATIRFNGAGIDEQWGTEDDEVASWNKPTQDHLTHQITNYYSLVDRSTKTTWTDENNPAFRLSSIYLREHAGKDFQHRNVFYSSLGENGEIDIDPTTNNLTAIDDQISIWYKGDFDLNGKRLRTWTLRGTNEIKSGKGQDGLLFTDDDIAIGLDIKEYYPDIFGEATSGLIKKTVSYYNSEFIKPLNEWFIDEANNIVDPGAIIHSYTIYRYDDLGTNTETLRYSLGDDGIMATEQQLLNGTSDDILLQRKTYSTSRTINGDLFL